jgi:hypothetical protein
MDTRGVQVTPRHIVFNGPIPDELWPRALQRVRDRAAALGATEVFVYVDKPGDHDVTITAPRFVSGPWSRLRSLRGATAT